MMTATEQTLVDRVEQLGAGKAAVAQVSEMRFFREFRDACAQNSCGKYGKCWMCPPDVGEIDEMIARAKGYGKVLVYQTVGELEDSFDIEGMEEAARVHNLLVQAVAAELRPVLERALFLGAGNCHVCTACTRPENQPCRHPDRAIPSLESYGVAVSELARVCGMNYINGENTVTYFGAVLYA